MQDKFNYSEIIFKKPYSTTDARKILGANSTTIREIHENGEIKSFLCVVT